MKGMKERLDTLMTTTYIVIRTCLTSFFVLYVHVPVLINKRVYDLITRVDNTNLDVFHFY